MFPLLEVKAAPASRMFAVRLKHLIMEADNYIFHRLPTLRLKQGS
ncbi:hypothetical protein [Sphingobacterium sp. BN32]|nr:hypothetical protein [Sphingobacterium sp. BN32]WKK58386.1 hypothetical protein QYC40_17300 [Sphingobacterium sp. BN32]